jgi:SnoaL-like protein
VSRRSLPAVAVAIGFIDCINRGDLDALGAVMSDDHRLEVLDEEAVVGRDANLQAWRGYFDSFPTYVLYPQRIAERGGTVAILGHTTGSHLGLPDEEERELSLIWVADCVDGTVRRWHSSRTRRRRAASSDSTRAEASAERAFRPRAASAGGGRRRTR